MLHSTTLHATDVTPLTLREQAGLTPPGRIDPRRSALVLIDYQEEYGIHGNLKLVGDAEALIRGAQLLLQARTIGLAVIHVHHHAAKTTSRLFTPGTDRVKPIAEVTPNDREKVIQKNMPGAFTQTALTNHLRYNGIDCVVLAGFMTHMTVDTTAREALALGFEVVVVADACATRDLPIWNGHIIPAQIVHSASLAAIADRFAWVATTAQVLATIASNHV